MRSDDTPARRRAAATRPRRSIVATPVVVAALITALVVPERPALAWGRMAHRAATRLAESRLTPEAKAMVRDLLEAGESLADASTWADENTRDIPGSAAWHYVNVPLDAPRYTDRDCHGACVVSKFHEFYNILADPTAPKPRRRMALRYVVHLVEDAHQPLHVGDNRDRGGNAVQLTFFRDDRTNLHQVWDSGLFRVGFKGERELVDELTFLARQPENKDWIRGNIEDWVDESLEAARQAYRVPGSRDRLRTGVRLGREYQDANLSLATRRLAQSGLRLSDVLNAAAEKTKPSRPKPAREKAPTLSR
jgi:nuclease S1